MVLIGIKIEEKKIGIYIQVWLLKVYITANAIEKDSTCVITNHHRLFINKVWHKKFIFTL